LNQFNEDFSTMSTINTESYNNMKAMLSDMYTAVDNKKKEYIEANQWELERIGIDAQNDAIILDNAQRVYELESAQHGTGYDAYDQDLIEKIVGDINRDDDVYLKEANPLSAMFKAKSAGQDPSDAYNLWDDLISKEVGSSVSSGGSYDNLVSQYRGEVAAGDLKYLHPEYTEEQLQSLADAINSSTMNTLTSSVAQGLKTYLSGGGEEGGTSKVEDIKDALTEMYEAKKNIGRKTGLWNSFMSNRNLAFDHTDESNVDPLSKTNFINDYSKRFTADIAEGFAKMYQDITDDNYINLLGEGEYTFYNSDSELTNEIADMLSNYIFR